MNLDVDVSGIAKDFDELTEEFKCANVSARLN